MIGNYSSIKSTSRHPYSEKSSQIRHHLNLVFIYYSSFADRNNYHLLKHQNYRRFLIDSEMVKSTSEFPEFDIMFKKISKGQSNAINFDQFLKLLPQLSLSLYQGDSRQVAFKKMIKNFIKKLQNEIRTNSQFGLDLSAIEQFLSKPSNQQDAQIIGKLQQASIIRKSYSVYISSTSIHQKSLADTFESFYKFLKDFQLSPQLIYKSICYVAFVNLMQSKEGKGKYQFDIETFVTMIILLGEIIAKKEYNSSECCSLSPTEKIYKILEKMEVSEGFQKISKLVKGETYFSMSLVRLVIGEEQQFADNCNESLDHQFDKGNSSQIRHKGCSIPGLYNSRGDINTSYQSLNLLAQNDPAQYKQIKKVFQDLCAYGQVGNNSTLKSMKVKRIFGQSGLLKVLSQADLDLIIAQIIRTSSSGKIQFQHFFQILNTTAKRLNVPETQVYNLIANTAEATSTQPHQDDLNSASRFAYNNEELQFLMEMLECTAYSLQRIFHHYSQSKNEIIFSDMSKLMYEFQVFPSILSKNRLFQIFLECHEESKTSSSAKQQAYPKSSFGKFSLYKRQQNSTAPNGKSSKVRTSTKQEKVMSISAFPLLLLKVSHEICQEGLSAGQKLIILLQKMHESKGQQKVIFGKGSLVSELRKKYAYVYKMSFLNNVNNTTSKKQEKQDIEDLLDAISEY